MSNMTVQQNMGAIFSPTATASTAAAQGSLLGCVATVVNSPMSLLANAAEEMTFANDTTDEFELAERKERDSVDNATRDRVEMYKDLMREAGGAQKLDGLKDSIKGRAGKEHALRSVRQSYPDSSDAFAALNGILDDLTKEKALGKDISQDVLDGIKAAIDTMEAEDGPAIRAGIQAAMEAKNFTGLGSDHSLRGLYRQVATEFQDVNDLYAHIQTKYGDNFDLALDFLYKTIGNDLATDVPSMETQHLESVNNNLGVLRQLQSAHSLCNTLLNRWSDVHGITDHKLDSMQLLGEIVSLRKENFIGGSRINEIAQKAAPPDIEHKVLFLQEMLNTTRMFTPSLFDGNEGRMKVINAVQDAVDIAVTEEDAYLASLEQ